MDNNPSININGVDIEWSLEKGSFNFFGTPSALFWINPSLLTMLQPLADEVGYNLFRLEVAASASIGTKEDYHAMVTVLGNTFEEGFLKWGEAVSSAGWGIFELPFFDKDLKKAHVRVTNTWELIMQKDLEERWGCPFIQGKIIGIFNRALDTNCWADEIKVSYDPQNLFIEFEVYESPKTVADEIHKERLARMEEKERKLTTEVVKKTATLNEKNQQLNDSLLELQQAKQSAEAANRVKSVFLSSMSHELRTPLNAVLGLGQLLEYTAENLTTEQIMEYAKEIQQSGNTMLSLIEEVLKYSEFETGKMTFSLSTIDPMDSIESAFQLHLHRAKLSNITLLNSIDYEQLPAITGDAHLLCDILSVFISNAIKYIPSGCEIKVSETRTNDGFLRIIVADNGNGIPLDKQAYLFEPFERLEHTGGSISGAGIGLSLAKSMATQMNGRIDFESKIKDGSRFWIDIPISGISPQKL